LIIPALPYLQNKRDVCGMKKKISICFLVFFSIFVSIFIPYRSAIVFEKDGKILAYFFIKRGETFEIRYTHSIHLSEVRETYKLLKDGTIQQIQLMYHDTSVGMPANAEEGEKFFVKDGAYYITGMKRKFDCIALSIGRVVANHQIAYKHKVVVLKKFIPPGSIVRIYEKRLSMFQLWKGVNIFG
jgi:hypothetical protein